MAGAILRLASTSVPICFSIIFVLSRRSITFRVAIAKHATKSVEVSVRVLIATIFHRTSLQARRNALRARGQLRGHAASATMSPRLVVLRVSSKGTPSASRELLASSALEALAVSPVSFDSVESSGAVIGLSEGSRVAVLRLLR